MKHFNRINGNRIYLSPINPDDYEIYTKWLCDPEVNQNIGSAHITYSLGKEKELLETLANGDTNFSIIAKDTNKVIGSTNLFDINEVSRHCEVGIFIGDPDYRNNGYGYETLKVLMNFGFNQLNMNAIMLKVFSYNKRAIKCYEKVGFKHTGTIRQRTYLNGEYHDTLIMDILKSEFVYDIVTK